MTSRSRARTATRPTTAAAWAGGARCVTERTRTHPGDASDQARYWRKRAFNYIDDHLGRLPVVLLARLGRAFDVYHPGSPFGSLKSGQTLVFELFEGRDANGSTWAARTALGQYFVLAPLAIVGAFVLRRRKVTLVPLLAPVVVVVSRCSSRSATPGTVRPPRSRSRSSPRSRSTPAISRWWRRGRGSGRGNEAGPRRRGKRRSSPSGEPVSVGGECRTANGARAAHAKRWERGSR